MQGLIHMYIGDGKGKTTAAFGLGLRCYGSGKTVYAVQFLKPLESGELRAVKSLGDRFKSFRFETVTGFLYNMDEAKRSQLKDEIRSAFEFVSVTLKEGSCDMLILDEIIDAVTSGMIDEAALLDALKSRKHTEVVMTGHNPSPAFFDVCNYVSEMKCIKHPYKEGIRARAGIEF